MMQYYATGITPARVVKMVGIGSQYAAATMDSEGKGFELPDPIAHNDQD